ncbi:hypothetical protein E1218_04930 [Kribbella turkmenica]|uniref:N-acetyltransferase domain-containing protein n=1 Tax=Kribbella turkmenica TaxID=2530375 RepID=A0A4R4XEV9_9ACTN|nr:GNAT family N-acetyltransferase [Kribbella turkmenica]TDD29214.1 hypothetical protein E1218_04930 [Kribbella turkmenica]
MTYTFTRACAEDADSAKLLLTQRAMWLASRRIDQWGLLDPVRTTEATIAAGETWLLRHDMTAEALATVTLSTRADRDFWTREEAATPALYMSKLATSIKYAGLGLGEMTCIAAWQYARQYGVGRLRADVWRSNTRLHDYYRGIGAEVLRTVQAPGRRSGTLIEWRDELDLRGAALDVPRLLTMDVRSDVLAIVASHRIDLGVARSGALRRSGRPSHQHSTRKLKYSNGRAIVLTDFSAVEFVLHHAGDRWRVNGRPVRGDALDQLQPGLLYRLHHASSDESCDVVITGDVLSGDCQLTPD